MSETPATYGREDPEARRYPDEVWNPLSVEYAMKMLNFDRQQIANVMWFAHCFDTGCEPSAIFNMKN